MGYLIRPVASLQELARVFELAGAQLPQRLTAEDRRLAELARRFPADRPLMLVAEDQGRIVGGGLAFRTNPAAPVGGVTLRLVGLAREHRGKGPERGFYLRMGYAGRARLRKQLPLFGAVHLPGKEWRRDLDELRQRRQRRLAKRRP